MGYFPKTQSLKFAFDRSGQKHRINMSNQSSLNEQQLGLLRENNPESVTAPKTSNPNAVKPNVAEANASELDAKVDDQNANEIPGNVPNISEYVPYDTEKAFFDALEGSNSPKDLEDFDLGLFDDEQLMKENEKDFACTSSQFMSDNTSSETPEEPIQKMADARFEKQNYIVQDQDDMTIFYTIKVGMVVQLSILPKFEDSGILIGIYHSHPKYVDKIISGVDSAQKPTTNDTPFTIFNMDDVHYMDVKIPFMKITMKAAVVKIKSGVSRIPIKFHLTSTNLNNYGQSKNGKEWHLFVMPLSEARAQNLDQNSELSLRDCIPSSKLRIQISKETRLNKKLKKQHHTQEVQWPFSKTMKRKRLELEHLEITQRKLQRISDEQLEIELARLKNTTDL